jgi:ribosomal protein S18 acetylase RimI-like enzyme
MNWSLRPAHEGDREFAWELRRTTMRGYVEQIWGAWDDAAQQARFELAFDGNRPSIIEIEGRSVGVILVAKRETEVFVSNIEVAPEFQGQGIGTGVLQAVFAEAASENLPVRLRVLRSNPRARSLYERLGFELEGQTETHFLLVRRPPVTV